MRIQKIVFLYFCILTISASAQSVSPKVIANSGGYAVNSSFGSLSYTIGEMAMVKTFSTPGIILTQGFQQPTDSAFVSGLITADNTNEGSLVLYPNPASTVLWLGYEFNTTGKINLAITDLTGREMPYHFTENYTGGKYVRQLNCDLLASGQYLFIIRFTGSGSSEPCLITRKLQVIK